MLNLFHSLSEQGLQPSAAKTHTKTEACASIQTAPMLLQSRMRGGSDLTPKGLMHVLFPLSVAQVLEWTRITIDAHLTRLLMSPTPLAAIEALEAALGGAVGAGQKMMILRGAAEHVQAQAPLPAAHMAVATQYTVELLDLRVR